MNKTNSTKTRIRDSVIHLMESTDFLQITVKMITEESGISRSTFYRHYESVEAVVLEIEDEILDGLAFINKMSLNDVLGQNSGECTFSRLARSSMLKDYSNFIRVINGPIYFLKENDYGKKYV